MQFYAADAERHFVFGAVLVGERHAAFTMPAQALAKRSSSMRPFTQWRTRRRPVSDQVLRPERGRQRRRGRLLQRSIAGKVAVRIVHALEVVGVHHQHGSGGAV